MKFFIRFVENPENGAGKILFPIARFVSSYTFGPKFYLQREENEKVYLFFS